MATIKRTSSGVWQGEWLLANGERHSKTTGTRNFEIALAKANKMEAVSRFWEAADEGTFSFLSELSFSPDFCYQNFPYRGHLKVEEFRLLLREADVKFKLPSKWRDGKNPAKKKYRFRNRSVTIDEALMETGLTITRDAVRSRLKNGWAFEDAVTKPKSERFSRKKGVKK